MSSPEKSEESKNFTSNKVSVYDFVYECQSRFVAASADNRKMNNYRYGVVQVITNLEMYLSGTDSVGCIKQKCETFWKILPQISVSHKRLWSVDEEGICSLFRRKSMPVTCFSRCAFRDFSNDLPSVCNVSLQVGLRPNTSKWVIRRRITVFMKESTIWYHPSTHH